MLGRLQALEPADWAAAMTAFMLNSCAGGLPHREFVEVSSSEVGGIMLQCRAVGEPVDRALRGMQVFGCTARNTNINWRYIHAAILADKAFPELVQWADELAALRRDIHAHPELGFETLVRLI